jgi:hypothetical protein
MAARPPLDPAATGGTPHSCRRRPLSLPTPSLVHPAGLEALALGLPVAAKEDTLAVPTARLQAAAGGLGRAFAEETGLAGAAGEGALKGRAKKAAAPKRAAAAAAGEGEGEGEDGEEAPAKPKRVRKK